MLGLVVQGDKGNCSRRLTVVLVGLTKFVVIVINEGTGGVIVALKPRSKQTGPSASPKPAMFVAPVTEQWPGCETQPHVSCAELKSFEPFMSEGFVSLVGSHEKVQIKKLRDTAAFD